MPKKPALIVLNGASSSGKTLTAQALQRLLGETCVITGFDDILERVRPFGDGFARPARILWFQITDGRFKLFKRLHREVNALVKGGHNVIVETSLMERRILLDAAECFAPLDGLFVGMKPPLEISEKWEASRDDRPQGQARRHYDLIHAHNTYDLILDPSDKTPQECAQAILACIQESTPTAFRRLLKAS